MKWIEILLPTFVTILVDILLLIRKERKERITTEKRISKAKKRKKIFWFVLIIANSSVLIYFTYLLSNNNIVKISDNKNQACCCEVKNLQIEVKDIAYQLEKKRSEIKSSLQNKYSEKINYQFKAVDEKIRLFTGQHTLSLIHLDSLCLKGKDISKQIDSIKYLINE